MASRTGSSLFRLLTPLLQTFRLPVVPLMSTEITLQQNHAQARHLHNTPVAHGVSRGYAGANPKDRAKSKRVRVDPRIRLIRYHLKHPKTPRPLRMSRMRSLRHWTIHRAWMLFRRKKRETEEGELLRMYQSMHGACEELRNLDDGGRLYRIAMEKKGIFGPNGLPIEYARAQTETRAREPWNHSWRR